MLLDILLLGHPSLRKKAEEVDPSREDVKKFVEDLIETTSYSPNRIGLAATQVNCFWRIFAVRPMINEGMPDMAYGPVEIFINPKISNPSKDLVTDMEGCLSIPGIYAPVTRPKSITIEYQNTQGQWLKKEASGYYARQLMHENDHLNGVLFIDRVQGKFKKKLLKDLNQLKKSIKSSNN